MLTISNLLLNIDKKTTMNNIAIYEGDTIKIIFKNDKTKKEAEYFGEASGAYIDTHHSHPRVSFGVFDFVTSHHTIISFMKVPLIKGKSFSAESCEPIEIKEKKFSMLTIKTRKNQPTGEIEIYRTALLLTEQKDKKRWAIGEKRCFLDFIKQNN